MSLLLTKNCEYALLVAIEEGQDFNPQNKEVLVTSKLNLALPRVVDDLIPPNTVLSTRPTLLTNDPQWRTTLVYYLSAQSLNRLRKKGAQVTLSITSLSESAEQAKLGEVDLEISQAKRVDTRSSKPHINQIQQFVVDKGEWHLIRENSRGQLKAGLFIVEMPSNISMMEKERGTPLQIPIKTSHLSSNGSGGIADLGLEIRSDVSDILMPSITDDDMEEEDDLDISHDDQEYEDEDEDGLNSRGDYDEYNYEGSGPIVLGKGKEQYILLFRILNANYISSIIENYPNIRRGYFQYELAGKKYECDADSDSDVWHALEYNKSLVFQGKFEMIKDWCRTQEPIQVFLKAQFLNGEDEVIGFAEVYLSDRELEIVQQSSIIYDCDRTWHINSENRFAALQSQIGFEIVGSDENGIYD